MIWTRLAGWVWKYMPFGVKQKSSSSIHEEEMK